MKKLSLKSKKNIIFGKNIGFKILDFNYIQPALDKEKDVVKDMNFGIITKAPNANFYDNCIFKNVLISILHDYSYFTMRIENPKTEPFFIEMCDSINMIGNYINLI